MNIWKLGAGFGLLLAATPGLADQGAAVPGKGPLQIYVLNRDSDGIAISVIDPVYYTLGGGPVDGVFYVFRDLTGTAGGVNLLDQPSAGSMTDGGPLILSGSALGTGLANGSILQIGGRAFAVEAASGAIWLRDVETGARHKAERQVATAPDAAGYKVNPQAFALE